MYRQECVFEVELVDYGSNTPTAVRLSKQVARSRIREIQSPKKALLHFIHDNSIEEDMLPESSASQRSH
ncbi:hypothetical protein COOONC_09838 [Cooperia oncophora]